MATGYITHYKLKVIYANADLALPNGEVNEFYIPMHNRDLAADKLMQDILAETHQDKKELVRQALHEFQDTSADAIADYYKVSRMTARALCKGIKRNTAKAHQGNDYEFRDNSNNW